MPTQMGFVRQRYKKTSIATTLTHYGKVVPAGMRVYIALLAFSCSTTDNADIIISLDGHGYDHVITSQINMVHGEWYHYKPQLWLEAGERLKFDWDGIVNTEVCEVHVTGHYQWIGYSGTEG